MRTAIWLAVGLLVCGTQNAYGHAEDASGFREWIAGWSKAHDAPVIDSWSGDLGDGGPDRVALLCSDVKEVGAYLVEDAHGKRFVASFRIDGRNGCTGKLARGKALFAGAAALAFNPRKGHRIEWTEAQHRGMGHSALALREGVLVDIQDGSFRIDADGPIALAQYGFCAGLTNHYHVDWDSLMQRAETHVWLHDCDHSDESDSSMNAVPKAIHHDQSILLARREPHEQRPFVRVLQGKQSYHGPKDASFGVAIWQHDKERLKIRIRITDDVSIRAKARTSEAVDVADHVLLRFGEGSMWLARDQSGAWFMVGALWEPAPDLLQVEVTGSGNLVEVRVPLEWPLWQEGLLDGEEREQWDRDCQATHCPAAVPAHGPPDFREGVAYSGSLLVGYSDVDGDGGLPSVIATDHIPVDAAAPGGVVVRMPNGGRWMPVVGDLK